jgi:hypothetical protein
MTLYMANSFHLARTTKLRLALRARAGAGAGKRRANLAVTERENVGMNRRRTGGDEDLFTAQLDLPRGGRIFFWIFRT